MNRDDNKGKYHFGSEMIYRMIITIRYRKWERCAELAH